MTLSLELVERLCELETGSRDAIEDDRWLVARGLVNFSWGRSYITDAGHDLLSELATEAGGGSEVGR